MTVAELLANLRSELACLADPARLASTQSFFKEPFRGYGVPTPRVRRMAMLAWREVKSWPLAQRNTLCNQLWKSGLHEEATLAIYLYRRFEKQCHACEFHLFEKWIDRYVSNWAQCDGVSAWLLGAAISNEPPLADQLPAWTESANRWKRRAAAVALIYPARRGLHTGLVFGIADRLRRDTDDMVQKGVGWMLKETYPKKPVETLRFLTTTQPPFPRLVLRYAAEKMNARDRKAALG